MPVADGDERTLTAPDGDPDPLWSVLELAAFLNVPTTTIYKWRQAGTAPPAIHVGRYLRWRRSDVFAWLNDRAERTA